jgi:hypothetical protein
MSAEGEVPLYDALSDDYDRFVNWGNRLTALRRLGPRGTGNSVARGYGESVARRKSRHHARTLAMTGSVSRSPTVLGCTLCLLISSLKDVIMV